MLLNQLPVQPIKNIYLTIIGGRSEELSNDQIGINKQNLANTNLTPYHDKVTIKRLNGERAVPLYTRKWFEVIPLDNSRPDALSKSPIGEIVLPEGPGIFRKPVFEFADREPVILNNVMTKILKNPADWDKLLVTNYAMKKEILISNPKS